MTRSLLAFTAVAAVIVMTPGLDTALVVRTTLVGGRRSGVVAALGVFTGLLLWGLATGLGVSLLVTASTVGYTALRICGAVWLVVLGVRAIVAARAASDVADVAPDGEQSRRITTAGAYRSGLLSNLLNPKIGVFYVTLLPQFVPAGASVLLTTMLLAGILAVEAGAWLVIVAWSVSRLRDLLRRGAVRRTMERITGAVLVGFGVRLALQRW
ncbi:MAG TPA: LysE family translocator [Candidatus Dormibacteraeota bacterium]